MATVLKLSLVLLICGVCFAQEKENLILRVDGNSLPSNSSSSNLTTTLKPETNGTTTMGSNINETTTVESKTTPTKTTTTKPLLIETTTVLPVKSNCTLTMTTAAARAARTKAPRSKKPRTTTTMKPKTTSKPDDGEFLSGIDNNPFFKELKF